MRDPSFLRDVQYVTTGNLDARASLHQRYSTADQEWFSWLSSQVDWRAYGSVLEVGCGTGLLWDKVDVDAVAHLELTLTDISAAMLEAASAIARPVVGSLRGLRAEVEALPLSDASFDLVVANHMLYHAADPRAALGELVRVLRCEGVLVASTNGTRHLAELYEIDTAVFGSSSRHNNHAEVFGRESGLAVLREVFDDVEWRAHPDALACTDVDDVVAYLLSAPPGIYASLEQTRQLNLEVSSRMASSGGVLGVSKDAGVFLCRSPNAGRGSP